MSALGGKSGHVAGRAAYPPLLCSATSQVVKLSASDSGESEHRRGILLPLLRKQQLDLEAQLPVRAAFWRDDVIVGLEGHIHGLGTDIEDAAHPAAKRERPLIS
jgi:hypothetical protein